MTIALEKKSDSQLQTDVLAELARDWRFRPAEVGVEVDDGVVTLTGTVSSYAKLAAAAEITARVSGVKDVANKLEVHLAGVSVRDDTDVAKAVRHALEWEPDVPEERIDCIVRQGVVTLKGAVDYWYQRKAAAETATHLIGVVSVKNEIQVVPPKRSDVEIVEDVERTLTRRMPALAKRISVSVHQGAVTLAGSVPTFADRLDAEHAAWSTRGVHSVLNRISVTG